MTVANLVVIHQLNFLDHKDRKERFNHLFDINSNYKMKIGVELEFLFVIRAMKLSICPILYPDI